MKPPNDDGLRFSADIEKLLRGEEPAGKPGDADYEETLQFARRLIKLREEPSISFADGLRRQLVCHMASQDGTASAQSWFGRLFHRPGLGIALASTFLVLAAVGLMWGAGLLPPSMLTAPSSSAPAISAIPEAPDDSLTEVQAPTWCQGESVRATGDAFSTASAGADNVIIAVHSAPAALSGEDVHISIMFSNHGSDGYQLSPFPPTIMIREATTGRIVHTFTGGAASYPLSALETGQYDMVWDQTDSEGVPVGAGRYEVCVDAFQIQPEKGEPTEWMGTGIATTFAIVDP